MVLIGCTTGTEALFHHLVDGAADPSKGVLGVPVEAWDDQGNPLVAGKNGLVTPANFRSNRFIFDRLSFQTSASTPDAEEPERFPVGDPDDPKAEL